MAPVRWKLVFAGLFVLSVTGILYLGYFCRGPNCALKKGNLRNTFKSNYDAYFQGTFIRNRFSEEEVDKEYDLDLEAQDVIVFLHIQKTGGTTFGKHLVNDLEVDPPCDCYKRESGKKRCDCLTRNKQVWLFSRYSTGWKCGLHADWTELKNCVDEWFQTEQGRKRRRYFYITMLRDPVYRFLSEWIHVSQRGGTWKTASLKCNGREATLDEVPFCYHTEDWKDVTLEQFMACKHNLAINRQTRMLANLSKVNCYNRTGMSEAERDRLILQSAKDNLKDMAYFGLMEFQNFSQFLFEHTLHINFLTQFTQYNNTHSTQNKYSPDVLKQIAELNHLDIELYQFAKDLFIQRVIEAYKEEDLPVPQQLMEHVKKAETASEITSDHKSNEDTEDVERIGAQSNDQFTQGVFERDNVQNVDASLNTQFGANGDDVGFDRQPFRGNSDNGLDRQSDRGDLDKSSLGAFNKKQGYDSREDMAAKKLRQSRLMRNFQSQNIGSDHY
ncbi:hypothetical protein BaRGS_00033263 [Batillaria attramentaria]|uniref:Heparan-sulfate 6-O-sulfotransferase n=1 Tax=Batillaria attramentaria TaxID=370345 RepID=A0ABD0JKF7_9CAEN